MVLPNSLTVTYGIHRGSVYNSSASDIISGTFTQADAGTKDLLGDKYLVSGMTGTNTNISTNVYVRTTGLTSPYYTFHDSKANTTPLSNFNMGNGMKYKFIAATDLTSHPFVFYDITGAENYRVSAEDSSFLFTVPEDVSEVKFRCEIHQGSMFGTIAVENTSPAEIVEPEIVITSQVSNSGGVIGFITLNDLNPGQDVFFTNIKYKKPNKGNQGGADQEYDNLYEGFYVNNTNYDGQFWLFTATDKIAAGTSVVVQDTSTSFSIFDGDGNNLSDKATFTRLLASNTDYFSQESHGSILDTSGDEQKFNFINDGRLVTFIADKEVVKSNAASGLHLFNKDDAGLKYLFFFSKAIGAEYGSETSYPANISLALSRSEGGQSGVRGGDCVPPGLTNGVNCHFLGWSTNYGLGRGACYFDKNVSLDSLTKQQVIDKFADRTNFSGASETQQNDGNGQSVKANEYLSLAAVQNASLVGGGGIQYDATDFVMVISNTETSIQKPLYYRIEATSFENGADAKQVDIYSSFTIQETTSGNNKTSVFAAGEAYTTHDFVSKLTTDLGSTVTYGEEGDQMLTSHVGTNPKFKAYIAFTADMGQVTGIPLSIFDVPTTTQTISAGDKLYFKYVNIEGTVTISVPGGGGLRTSNVPADNATVQGGTIEILNFNAHINKGFRKLKLHKPTPPGHTPNHIPIDLSEIEIWVGDENIVRSSTYGTWVISWNSQLDSYPVSKFIDGIKSSSNFGSTDGGPTDGPWIILETDHTQDIPFNSIQAIMVYGRNAYQRRMYGMNIEFLDENDGVVAAMATDSQVRTNGDTSSAVPLSSCNFKMINIAMTTSTITAGDYFVHDLVRQLETDLVKDISYNGSELVFNNITEDTPLTIQTTQSKTTSGLDSTDGSIFNTDGKTHLCG